MKNILLKSYYKILKTKEKITVLFNKIISLIVKPPQVNTTDETIKKIINEKCSISRYGDGELALMYREDLLFQPFSPQISLRLKEIIKSNQENHIVCIPDVFSSVDWCTEKSKKYWIKYLNLNRFKIYKMLDMNKNYYDTQVTRLYIDHKDKSKTEMRFQKLGGLWNKRNVVIVEGEQSRLGIGNDLFNNVNSIKRVLCPAKNAFAKYNKILDEVKKHDRSDLILIALGPTATILSYDLSKLGYQAIDIGHIDIEYEWFLQKAAEKGPIKNKYIGEVPNGTIVDYIEDKKYISEIVSRVV